MSEHLKIVAADLPRTLHQYNAALTTAYAAGKTYGREQVNAAQQKEIAELRELIEELQADLKHYHDKEHDQLVAKCSQSSDQPTVRDKTPWPNPVDTLQIYRRGAQ